MIHSSVSYLLFACLLVQCVVLVDVRLDVLQLHLPLQQILMLLGLVLTAQRQIAQNLK